MSSSSVLSRRRSRLGTWMCAPTAWPCSSRLNSPAPPDGWRLSKDLRTRPAPVSSLVRRPNPRAGPPIPFIIMMGDGLLGAESFSDSVSEGTLPEPPSKSKKPESDLNITGGAVAVVRIDSGVQIPFEVHRHSEPSGT